MATVTELAQQTGELRNYIKKRLDTGFAEIEDVKQLRQALGLVDQMWGVLDDYGGRLATDAHGEPRAVEEANSEADGGGKKP